MKPLAKYFLFTFFSVISFASIAQDTNPVVPPANSGDDSPPETKQYYLLSPRVSVTVPHPMLNKSFKKSFVGIYEVSGGLNLFIYKGFFIGLAGKNGLLKITENKIADYNASMAINNAAAKVGGDWYVGDKNKVIFSLGFTAGHNWTKYSDLMYKDPNKKPLYTKFETNYIEPEMNLFFLIESNFAIGATVSYTIFDAHFNPYDLDLNEYSQFSTNNAAATQFLSFGFGFYYSLLPKK
ncbi:MAG: hypothetical protein ACXVPU_12330 [Bacteroidia bacterium]